MFNMEKLANNISNKIGDEFNFDKDKREVISYGTFALLQTVFSISVLVIIASLFNVLLEALIISFTTSILRKYSGGVHASSPGKCVLLGTIMCMMQTLLVKLVLCKYVSLSLIIICGLLSFGYSYYMIYKLAPVDSVEKPIKTQSKKKRMKKKSILILNVYVMISIVNVILYILVKDSNFIIYNLCIYIGIIWQVFTLTRLAHVVLGK